METKIKHISNYLNIVALILVGVLPFGCAGIEDTPAVDPNTAGSRIVTLTTTLGFDGGAETRALTEDGVKTFVAGEKVAVIYWHELGYYTKTEYELKETDIRNGGKTADMTFSLTSPMEGTTDIAFVYPASLACTDYAALGEYYNMEALRSQQDGTFNHITQWDAAIGTGEMTVSSGTATLSSCVSMKNPFCIVDFSLKDGNNTALNAKITDLNITAGNYNYHIKRTASADQIYLAMKPVNNEKVTITYKDGDDLYSTTVTTTLGANKIYPVNATLTKINPREIPLTLKAVKGGRIVFELWTPLYDGKPVIYTKNGEKAGEIYSGEKVNISVSAGDEISFYGNNTTYYQQYDYHTYHTSIKCETQCLIYGNIMSLVKGRKEYSEDPEEGISNAFATATELTGYNTFEYLFSQNESYLLNHALPIVLPATTLTPYCYRGMFSECHALTVAPELPATELQASCYREMFMGCWSLTKAPDLPATELKSECYRAMFMDCKNLSKAPSMSATLLADECCVHMFTRCTKLTASPALLAPALVGGCYRCMFYNCSKLNYVRCFATSGITDANTHDWLHGVAEQGTFGSIANVDFTDAGIPSGWQKDIETN